MHEIQPGLLWIGHALDVREPEGLFELEITAVIDVAYEEPCAQMPRQLTYCRFPLNDGGGNRPETIKTLLKTASDLLDSNTKTLIACSAGMSRSPTVAAFVLALHLNEAPDSVISRIAEIKSLELKPELWSDVLAVFQQLVTNHPDSSSGRSPRDQT